MNTMQLTEEQQKVADAVVSAKPGSMVVLRGFAGTGKTYLASQIINSGAFEAPLVVAPTAVALNALKRKFAGRVPNSTKFNTFAYLTSRPVPLLKVGKYPKTYSVRMDGQPPYGQYELSLEDFVTTKGAGKDLMSFIESYETETGMRYEADTAGIEKALGIQVVEDVRFDQMPDDLIADRLIDNDLVVIDEYSMIDQKKHDLVTRLCAIFAEEGRGPVIMVCGDAGQLQPVNATINDAIRLEPDGEHVFELTKPMRSGDDIANFASRLRKGAKLSSMASSPANTKVRAVNGSVRQIFADNADVFAQADIALTWKNSNVKQLNEMMRAQRGFSGTVCEGEKVVVAQNLYSGPGEIEWAKGEIMQVQQIKDPAPVLAKLGEKVSRIVQKWREDAAEKKVEFEALRQKKNRTAAEEAEQVRREMKQLKHRADDLEDAYDGVRSLLETGELALVVLTDGFGTDTSERAAVISTSMADPADKLWRAQKRQVRQVSWLLGAKPVDLSFAYALTVHKAQGSELDHVVYLAASGEIWAQGKGAYDGADWHAPYTAVTRARETVQVLYSGDSKIN